MEPFIVRYRNLLVLLALLVAQIIGLAVQVRRTAGGRVSYDVPDGSGVRLIRLWVNDAVWPAERLVQAVQLGVGGFWENYLALSRIRQQNKDLQATVDRLRLEQDVLLEDARQGQRLQALNHFQEKYLYSTTPAQVIGTSGSDLSRVFTIDKGKRDGIVRDMAVVTADGIIGKVREVFPQSSQVLAINDQSSGAGVILETTRIRGILRGNAAGQPQIVGILADQRIKPGEKVLTAGGDQIFPRGLPVGTVAKVERDPERDGFIHVIVNPAANLDKLDEVMVVTSLQSKFSPQQENDLATSEAEKSADAAALAEQRKASEVMAERLPGLTDPNAPKPAPTATTGATGAATATPPAATVPKILPAQHPDRFTPGYSGGTAVPEPAPDQNSTHQDTARPGTTRPDTKPKPAAPSAAPGKPAPQQSVHPQSAPKKESGTGPNTPPPQLVPPQPGPKRPAPPQSNPQPQRKP